MYEGNRRFCISCQYFHNCKMIDHDKVKLYRPYFKEYQSIKEMTDICFLYEPLDWYRSEWKGMAAYIQFLEDVFGAKALDERKICLVYEGNHYYVTWRSWLTGTMKSGSRNILLKA